MAKTINLAGSRIQFEKTLGECAIIYAKEADRWHLSISHPTRLPTYDEVKQARYDFLPDDVYMAMIFPPKSEFVNVHPFCLHLWEVSISG